MKWLRVCFQVILYPWVRYRIRQIKRRDHAYWALLILTEHVVGDLLSCISQLHDDPQSWTRHYTGTLENGLNDRWFHLQYKYLPPEVTLHDMLVGLKKLTDANPRHYTGRGDKDKS